MALTAAFNVIRHRAATATVNMIRHQAGVTLAATFNLTCHRIGLTGCAAAVAVDTASRHCRLKVTLVGIDAHDDRMGLERAA